MNFEIFQMLYILILNSQLHIYIYIYMSIIIPGAFLEFLNCGMPRIVSEGFRSSFILSLCKRTSAERDKQPHVHI